MAKVQVTPVGVRVTLDLNDDEAIMLMAMMQNPVGSNEGVIAEEVRMAIFTALKEAGV